MTDRPDPADGEPRPLTVGEIDYLRGALSDDLHTTHYYLRRLVATVDAERARADRAEKALRAIAEPDPELDANGPVYGLHAARRMQAQARTTLEETGR